MNSRGARTASPTPNLSARWLRLERLLTLARRLRAVANGSAVRWGNLRRVEPFCANFGISRGDPVDRYYIEGFLTRHADLIHGDVLEVQDQYYTSRYAKRVTRAHVVDIDPGNENATLVADLCDTDSLPEQAYDTIILTQVIQVLVDPVAALRNMWRSLRPGGSLLITGPTMGKLAYDLGEPLDYWRWTPDGFRELLRTALPQAGLQVAGAGNLLACIAYLMGMAQQDLSESDMRVDDPIHHLIVTALVTKPSG